MIERQLKARGITDERLLKAFMKVERHRFVPGAIAHLAYDDGPLAIGHGQTISQPYIVAIMIDLLEVSDTDIVLEIGTGSGYQTALLAELAQHVYSMERIPALADRAQKTLMEMGYTNVDIQVNDGTVGWVPEIDEYKEMTFDGIIISAAAPSPPQKLIDQLKDNGRMVLPTGSRFFQDLLLVVKEDGNIRQENHGGCQFVPLIGEQGWKN